MLKIKKLIKRNYIFFEINYNNRNNNIINEIPQMNMKTYNLSLYKVTN